MSIRDIFKSELLLLYHDYLAALDAENICISSDARRLGWNHGYSELRPDFIGFFKWLETGKTHGEPMA